MPNSMRRRLLFSLLCCALLPACREEAKPSDAKKITIACAASMRFAMEEAVAAWQKSRPDVSVTVTYGSSGAFFAQLTQRAPFDLFLSADTDYPRKLVEAGHVERDFPYAVGRLALWVPKSSGLDAAGQGLKCLLDPKVKKVAIANPQLAPYGRAAEAALVYYGLTDQVKDRLVLAENVGQAVQFVQSGAAQAGLVALSLTLASEVSGSGITWIVPEEAHPRLEQSGVVLPWSRQRAEAEAFRDWLLSAKGQAILRRHGFTSPAVP